MVAGCRCLIAHILPHFGLVEAALPCTSVLQKPFIFILHWGCDELRFPETDEGNGRNNEKLLIQ